MECYETAIKSQPKKEIENDDGIIVDNALAFKLNSINYYSQIESQNRPLLKSPIRKDSFFGDTSIREEESADETDQPDEKGERFYMPDFGTNLMRYIFNQNDTTTHSEIKRDIQDTVKTDVYQHCLDQ